MTTFDPDEVARFRVAIARITKGVDRRVGVDGMSRAQLSVLSTLARQGPMTAGELARHEGLNPTMLSRLLGKLEEHGLAVRAVDPDDKRVVRAAATAPGKALHRRLRRERTALFTAQLDLVGADTAVELRDALPALETFAASLTDEPTR